MKKISNPYLTLFPNLTEKDLRVMACNVHSDDRALIHVLCPEYGVNNYVLATLFQKFIHELRRNNIKWEADFRLAVEQCEIVFPGSDEHTIVRSNRLINSAPRPGHGTSSGVVQEPYASDVGSGDTRQGRGDTSDASEPSDIQGKDGGDKKDVVKRGGKPTSVGRVHNTKSKGEKGVG